MTRVKSNFLSVLMVACASVVPALTSAAHAAFIFEGHTYQVVEAAVTWQAAKEAAEAGGGYLLTITTSEEMQYVKDSILNSDPQVRNRTYWIGLQSDASATWSWVTGDPLVYQNWEKIFNSASEPNQRGIMNQEHVDRGSPAGERYLGKWNSVDSVDTLTSAYIIEYAFIPAPAALPAGLALLGMVALRRRKA